jgi:hypothetical protein
MNIDYIHRLIHESTDERNSDEIKSSYLSVPTNVTIYSSVTMYGADLICGLIYSSASEVTRG